MIQELDDTERRRLVEIQLELECVRITHGNLLTPFPCANPDAPPRVLAVDTGTSHTVYFRHDLPPSTRSTLETLSPEQCFRDASLVRSTLAHDAPVHDISRFRVNVLISSEASISSSNVVQLDTPNDHGHPVFAVVVDGEAISACSSARENERCGEAYVFTDERYRGRGYATQVVSAWAHSMRVVGKLPFYSHLLDNVSSARVALRLDASPVFEAIGYA